MVVKVGDCKETIEKSALVFRRKIISVKIVLNADIENYRAFAFLFN